MDHAAGHGDLRVRILIADLDVRVAFVIFELDVVMRFVAFDEVHLQDERFQFGFHNDPFDVVNVLHQLPGLFRVPGVIDKVGFHPVAQVDGFADVDDLVIGVFHQVAAGFFRQCRQCAADGFVNLDHFFASGNKALGHRLLVTNSPPAAPKFFILTSSL